MPILSDSAVLGVSKLVELGVLSESGLEDFGNLVKSLQSLGGGKSAPSQRASARRVSVAGGPAKKGRRARFVISEADLRKLYATSTAKEIAETHGVSTATVNNRLREYGIQKEGRAKPARKKAKKKAAKKPTLRVAKKASKKKSKRGKKKSA